ncbi:MAG TPA: hypothetical protein VNI55_10100 [Gaiellaceae bacterium]|nr:hypothetical protein [Gaiellaceae bacterium]
MASRLEANDPCAARVEAEALQADTIAAVNAGRVPPRYQEELTGSVSSLVSSIECTLSPPSGNEEDKEDEADEEERDTGKGKKNEKNEKKEKKERKE